MRVYEKPPADVTCPAYGKPMSKVCSACVKWIGLRGNCPNTGKELDGFQCADVAQVLFTLELTQMVRQSGAATESMRNEIVSRMDYAQRRVSAEKSKPEIYIEAKQ